MIWGSFGLILGSYEVIWVHMGVILGSYGGENVPHFSHGQTHVGRGQHVMISMMIMIMIMMMMMMMIVSQF